MNSLGRKFLCCEKTEVYPFTNKLLSSDERQSQFGLLQSETELGSSPEFFIYNPCDLK